MPAGSIRDRASRAARTPLPNVLVLSAVATLVLAAWILVFLGGWTYYRTPLRVRGYVAAHRILRPSGLIGHGLGILGLAMIVLPLALYSARKRWKRLAKVGSLHTWLEVHIFCGITGAALITFHTSFKFGGIVSVAYWSMVLVVISGFVGRYLYVRIPKSIRGAELTQEENLGLATELKAQLAETTLPGRLLAQIDAFERDVLPDASRFSLASFLFGQMAMRWKLRRLGREIERSGVEPRLLRDVVSLTAERAVLLWRLAYLHKTKKAFATWHVFHQPLVYMMFAIVALHIAVALYLGYSFL